MISYVVKKVGRLVKKELNYTSTRNAKSLYGNKSLEDLNMFNWSKLALEVKRTMPTLFSILDECIKSKDEKDIVIGFLGGVLLKQHNERMTYVQRLFSVLLYSSHCSKQV